MSAVINEPPSNAMLPMRLPFTVASPMILTVPALFTVPLFTTSLPLTMNVWPSSMLNTAPSLIVIFCPSSVYHTVGTSVTVPETISRL